MLPPHAIRDDAARCPTREISSRTTQAVPPRRPTQAADRTLAQRLSLIRLAHQKNGEAPRFCGKRRGMGSMLGGKDSGWRGQSRFGVMGDDKICRQNDPASELSSGRQFHRDSPSFAMRVSIHRSLAMSGPMCRAPSALLIVRGPDFAHRFRQLHGDLLAASCVTLTFVLGWRRLCTVIRYRGKPASVDDDSQH